MRRLPNSRFGGGSVKDGVNESSQEQTFNYWASALADNCSTLDTSAPLCDSQGKITAVIEKDATNCRSNTEVRFYKLSGGIHTWYNTPNLRFLSIKDFRQFCKDRNITIERERAIGNTSKTFFFHNLLANVAIFLIKS